MSETQEKAHNKLREAVIANWGEGEFLSVLDGLLVQSAKLKDLEASVLKKAEMLRDGWWDLSDEMGVAGVLHQAITDLWIELENEAKARQTIEEKLASQ